MVTLFHGNVTRVHYPFPRQALDFTYLQYKTFENTVGKGAILLRAISPFPTAFFTDFENFLPFSSNSNLSSANSFRMEASKICRLGKGYTTLYHSNLTFNDLDKEACRKHYGKRRKCWYPAFSPFPIKFSTLPKQISNF